MRIFTNSKCEAAVSLLNNRLNHNLIHLHQILTFDFPSKTNNISGRFYLENCASVTKQHKSDQNLHTAVLFNFTKIVF